MRHVEDEAKAMGSLRSRVKAAREVGRGRAKEWNERMLAEADDATPRGVRWSRGSLALVPATAAVLIIGLAIAQGLLAASFNVSNQKFDLHVKTLDGTGLGAVLAASNLKNSDSSTQKAGVLHAGLKSAKLSGLCIVVHQSMLGVKYSITVGAGGAVASDGQNLFFDITDLNATPATLRGAILGESADDVAINGTSLGGTPGAFGLDVTRGTVNLANVVGSAYQAQVAGSLKLPNLAINVKLGDVNSC
ncbi:MAG: DUF6230 family protein [Jatrophihabitans sp.]